MYTMYTMLSVNYVSIKLGKERRKKETEFKGHGTPVKGDKRDTAK